jgi:hypothetical protein
MRLPRSEGELRVAKEHRKLAVMFITFFARDSSRGAKLHRVQCDSFRTVLTDMKLTESLKQRALGKHRQEG